MREVIAWTLAIIAIIAGLAMVTFGIMGLLNALPWQ